MRLGGPRQVAVLARLLLSPGHVVSMSQLAESIWDGDSPSRPEVAIRSYVSNLRRSIEPGRHRGDRNSRIESHPPGYRLAVAPQSIDAHQFEELIVGGRRALADDRFTEALNQLTAAAGLWRGEPCEGLVETDAFVAFGARMAELHMAMTELTFEARLGLGEHEAVIANIEAAIVEHPLRERLTALGMLALYQADRQSEALALCGQLRTRLIESLGIDPGPPIQELEHKILTHDASLSPTMSDPSSEATGARETDLRSGDAETTVQGYGYPRPGIGPGSGDADPESVQLGPAASRLSEASSGSLVGRHRELRALAAIGANISSGRGATALITGEPGSGKSSLVATLAATLARTGIVVTWGRARELGCGTALWPWSQILDGLRPHIDDADLIGLDQLQTISPTFEPSPPEPSDSEPGSPPPGPSGPSIAFGAVVELLRRVSERTSLVVVVEDAHWADVSSIELVQFAATALSESPVAFITTWTDTDTGTATARKALRGLARVPEMTRIELGCLDLDAVDQLIEQQLPTSVGADRWRVAARIVELSGGNALMASELIRSLGDDLTPVPTRNLSESILDRVDRCHPDALSVLSVAALFMSGVSAEVLADIPVLGRPDVEPTIVEEALDAAQRAGILVDDDLSGQDYRFRHPVVADVLTAELSRARRARIHGALGHTMWRRGWAPDHLTHHFVRAGSTGTSILAARFALESVTEVTDLEAICLAESAMVAGLEAIQRVDGSELLEGELCSFLAQCSRLRGDARYRETMVERLLAIAGREGGEELRTVALMVATGPSIRRGDLDQISWMGVATPPGPALSRLQAGLDLVDDADPLRPAIDARVALFEHGREFPDGKWWKKWLSASSVAPKSGDTTPGSGSGLSAELDDRAGKLGLLSELGRALLDRGKAADRLQAADLIAAIAEPSDVHQLLLADRLRLLSLLETAPALALDTITAPARLPQDAAPSLLDIDRAGFVVTNDLLRGRFGAARIELERLDQILRAAGVPLGPGPTGQLLALCWDTGGIAEWTDRYERRRDSEPVSPIGFEPDAFSMAELALLAAELGRLDEARARLDALLDSGALGANPSSLIELALVAVAAHRSGHIEGARFVVKPLTRERAAPITTCGGFAVLGPAAYFAGLASSVVGDSRRARELLDEAELWSRAVGAPAVLVRTLSALAELDAVEHEVDAVEARMGEAKATASDIGMGWFDIRDGR